MHGVGAETVRRGVRPRRVPAAPRGAPSRSSPTPTSRPWPSRTRRSPAPSTSSLALARSVGADLVLANDPDADRLGVAIPDPTADGGWRALTGDEIGALLADHLLRTGPLRPRRRGRHHRRVVAPPVDAGRATAGVAYGEALTGFKWVVRTPAPGPAVRCSATRRRSATAWASSCATRTASPPRSSPPSWPPQLRAEGSSLARAPRRARPRPRRPRHPPALASA